RPRARSSARACAALRSAVAAASAAAARSPVERQRCPCQSFLSCMTRRRRSTTRALTFSISLSLFPLTSWPRSGIRPPMVLACLASLLRLARQRVCFSALLRIMTTSPLEGGGLRNPCQAKPRRDYVTHRGFLGGWELPPSQRPPLGRGGACRRRACNAHKLSF